MSDVFISYSRDDLEHVQLIAEAIQREGYDLWWDADLPPHRSYGDVIQEKIGGAKAVVVVWSDEATKSEWVRAEADMARNQRKLIQTSIDDGMPPLPFNQIQYASLSDWEGDSDHPAWRKVLVSLADLVGDSTQPVPPAKKETVTKATPTPEPHQSSSEPTRSQWPLLISLAALIGVAGLAIWFFLNGNEAGPETFQSASAEIAETDNAEPAVPPPVPEKPEPQPATPPPSEQDASQFNESAVIEDSDGWTNIRQAPSRSSAIVGRVKAGQVFDTYRQSGPWWRVRTDDGVIGYMHYSRISLSSSRPSTPRLFFPDSGVRLISASELKSLSKSELRLARNEIFARRGRIFNSPDLRDHFSRFDWYQPRSAEVEVNNIEKANARTMQAEERRR